jgi:hypothetical protein
MTFKVQVGPPQISIQPRPDGADQRAGRTDQLAERKGSLLRVEELYAALDKALSNGESGQRSA